MIFFRQSSEDRQLVFYHDIRQIQEQDVDLTCRIFLWNGLQFEGWNLFVVAYLYIFTPAESTNTTQSLASVRRQPEKTPPPVYMETLQDSPPSSPGKHQAISNAIDFTVVTNSLHAALFSHYDYIAECELLTRM